MTVVKYKDPATGQFGLADVVAVNTNPGGGGISQADADARYVNVAGDTMTGILNIASHGILVDSPGTAYVAIDRNNDTNMGQFEFRTNGIQDFVLGTQGAGTGRHFRIYTNGKEVDVLRIERNTGHISLLNGTDLTLFNEPTAAKHAATKGYVDSRGYIDQTAADARYINVSGDTMTGPLVLPGNAASNLQAVPKQQLDAAVGTLDLDVQRIRNNLVTRTGGASSLTTSYGVTMLTTSTDGGNAWGVSALHVAVYSVLAVCNHTGSQTVEFTLEWRDGTNTSTLATRSYGLTVNTPVNQPMSATLVLPFIASPTTGYVVRAQGRVNAGSATLYADSSNHQLMIFKLGAMAS